MLLHRQHKLSTTSGYIFLSILKFYKPERFDTNKQHSHNLTPTPPPPQHTHLPTIQNFHINNQPQPHHSQPPTLFTHFALQFAIKPLVLVKVGSEYFDS